LSSGHNNYDVKLGDFGLSRYFSSALMMHTRVGTPLYVAPEVLMNKGYGPGVDMWAVGVLTYILLSGKPPFPCDNMSLLFQCIMSGTYSFQDLAWVRITSAAKDFIKQLLFVEPSLRLTAARALEHPWLKIADRSLI
jgi:serine/threonine protein kinase